MPPTEPRPVSIEFGQESDEGIVPIKMGVDPGHYDGVVVTPVPPTDLTAALRTALERLPRFSIDVETVERPLTPSARGLLVRLDDVRAALASPPPTDPTAALRTAVQAVVDDGWSHHEDFVYVGYYEWAALRAALATSQADDPSERATISAADMQDHIDRTGYHDCLRYQADDPSGLDVEAAVRAAHGLLDIMVKRQTLTGATTARDILAAALRESPDGE